MHSLQPPVVREAAEAGRRFDCLVYCLLFSVFFSFLVSSCVWGSAGRGL